MLRLATIACVIMNCLGAVPTVPKGKTLGRRMVGAADTDITDFPYMASVEVSWHHKCGGVIINEDWVLTSANCIYNVLTNNLDVRAGTNKTGEGGVRIRAFKYFIHDAYNSDKPGNDIALIEVVTKLPMGSTIQAIPMTFNTPAEGVVATITGWDATTPHPRQLKTAQITVISQNSCNQQYNGYLLPKTFCAGLADGDYKSCDSESGGPVVANGELIGLMSADIGCFVADKPRLHTDVASFRPWINVYTNL